MGNKRKNEQQVVDLEEQIKKLKSEMEKLQKNRDLEKEDSEASDDNSIIDHNEKQMDDSEDEKNGGEISEVNEEPVEEDKENDSQMANCEKPLNQAVMLALGDESEEEVENVVLHSSITKRWIKWLKKGMKADSKEKLLAKYPNPSGMEAPVLNPEVVAILQDNAVKRDKYIEERQRLEGAALAAIGFAIQDIDRSDEEGLDIHSFVEKLGDAAKFIIEAMHGQTESRKAFILPGVDKHYQKILENAVTDEFLFGKNLSERIKQAKAIDKIGSSMKIQSSKKAGQRPPLNQRSLYGRRPALIQAAVQGQPAFSHQMTQPRQKFFFKNRAQFNPRNFPAQFKKRGQQQPKTE